MPRFSIDGKVYDAVSLDAISLKDLLEFNRQAGDAGIPYTWDDVEALVEKEEMTSTERLLTTTFTLWLSKRLAGDTDTLDEVTAIPMTKIKWVADPEDHGGPTKPAKAPGKKKPAKKTAPGSARAGSGAAGKRAAPRTPAALRSTAPSVNG